MRFPSMVTSSRFVPVKVLSVLVLALLAALGLFSLPREASAQTYTMTIVRSTADLTVTASATREYIFREPLKMIYLKNDCAKPLWFDLNGLENYNLKLLQNQDFQAFVFLKSITVSPDNTGTACTFTAVGGK